MGAAPMGRHVLASDPHPLEKIYQIMVVHAGFGRQSGPIDIGAGLNILALHAATTHSLYAVGIVTEQRRVLRAASIILQYWKEHADQSLNHRVALVYADALAVKPVDYGTHTFFHLVLYCIWT
jgi:hypothetical protein